MEMLQTLYKFTQLMAVVMVTCFHGNDCLKILALPYSICLTSHVIDMEKLVSFLATNGHNVTLYVQDTYNKPISNVDFKNINFLHFKSHGTMDAGLPVCQQYNNLADVVNTSFYKKMSAMSSQVYDYCDLMLADKAALQHLEEENFDLIIVDMYDLCRYFLIDFLSKPAIGLSPLTCILPNKEVPCSPAYVPTPGRPYTNHMTFFQRVGNSIFPIFRLALVAMLFPGWEKIRTKHEIPTTMSLQDTFEQVTMKFIKSDPAIDYPSPMTPNLVFIGSFFINKAKPLSRELEDFMKTSGEHGVILMSFGSHIKYFPDSWGEMFADAFARLPQKVIWRYQGEPPKNLGNNTKLLPWLPQTDLLDHPKTRLFISHCGVGGVYEAAYYGVPILAIPLMGDQAYFSLLVTQHLKMGVKSELTTLTSDDLYQAINEVLLNPTYRQNAQKVSARFRDQLVSSEDQILHTINYVHRHDGATHLRSAAYSYTWYQHLLLDVIAFLLLILLIFALCGYCLCKCAYNYCCKVQKGRKKKRKLNDSDIFKIQSILETRYLGLANDVMLTHFIV